MKETIHDAQALTGARFNHECERIDAELKFAADLCDLNPRKAAAWRPLIEKAARLTRAAVLSGDVANVQKSVKKMEKTLAPLAAVAKSYNILCVGHAHIDMNWMWSWPETVAVVTDTTGTVLRLMEEYPDFCFSQSQASIYQILEKFRPDLLARVAARVKEGRWEVTASHWVEGDKNMAGAESLCRQVLYTRRYMKKLFGLEPEDVPIDWSPDTFGFPATTPTYLARAGVKYMYLHRPGTLVTPKQWMFRWEGPDGSSVLVRNDSRSRCAYNGVINVEMCKDLLSFVKETGLKDFMFVYGVGDHGGGPTRRDIEQAIDMNSWAIFPNVRFSTARAFYNAVSGKVKDLPVLRGELNFEFAGCYTSQSLIKKGNRYGENRLVEAETVAGLVSALGALDYPAAGLEEGWRNVLFNQFHDILPGSGVMDTRTYSHGIYQQTVALTSQAESRALQALAAAIDTSGLGGTPPAETPASRIRSGIGSGVGFGTHDGGISRAERSSGSGNRPIVLFNPLAFDRTEIVEVNVWDNGPAGRPQMKSRSYEVRAPDGTRCAGQVTGGGNYWGHDYATVAFPATVPAMGYAVYTIIEDGAGAPSASPGKEARQTGETHHCSYSLPERSPEGLENSLIRAEIDPQTGAICRLVDKSSGLELIDPKSPAPALEYETERHHGMSSWLVQHRGSAPEYPRVRDIRRVAKGPYLAEIQVDLNIRESDFTVSYKLRAGDPRLFIGIKGTWFQRGTKEAGVPALSFALPLGLTDAAIRCEIPFGAIDRNLNRREEMPSQRWVQVSGRIEGKSAGCLVLNDSKYGHSLEGNTLRVTLIRSSYEPDTLPEIGQHSISLAIQPFAGELPVADAIRAGQAFNHWIKSMGADLHKGSLPLASTFVRVSPDAAILCGMKKAEDSHRLILRLFNPTDKRVTATLDLTGGVLTRVKNVEELDLLERPLKGGTARAKGSIVTVAIPPRGIASVAVECG